MIIAFYNPQRKSTRQSSSNDKVETKSSLLKSNKARWTRYERIYA